MVLVIEAHDPILDDALVLQEVHIGRLVGRGSRQSEYTLDVIVIFVEGGHDERHVIYAETIKALSVDQTHAIIIESSHYIQSWTEIDCLFDVHTILRHPWHARLGGVNVVVVA